MNTFVYAKFYQHVYLFQKKILYAHLEEAAFICFFHFHRKYNTSNQQGMYTNGSNGYNGNTGYRSNKPGGFGGRINKADDGNFGSALQAVAWENHTLSDFKKDFYCPHANVLNRPYPEVERYRESKDIMIKGIADAFLNPIQFFEEGNFPEYVATSIK